MKLRQNFPDVASVFLQAVFGFEFFWIAYIYQCCFAGCVWVLSFSEQLSPDVASVFLQAAFEFCLNKLPMLYLISAGCVCVWVWVTNVASYTFRLRLSFTARSCTTTTRVCTRDCAPTRTRFPRTRTTRTIPSPPSTRWVKCAEISQEWQRDPGTSDPHNHPVYKREF